MRPVIVNGTIDRTIIINSGIGYDPLTTEARVFTKGKNGSLSARVRSLTVNSAQRFGDFNLTSNSITIDSIANNISHFIVHRLSLIHI